MGSSLALFTRPRLVFIFLMGFASGLPLALTGATLARWLAEDQVSLSSIGFFALAGIAYNFKFLWAPLLDRVPLPWLTSRLGRRRSWALVIQAGLIVAILGLGASDPAIGLRATALWAVALAFFSASQDVVIDAYRVELLEEAEQGAGAAATQMGYRLGMIVSGAGALYAATYLGWSGAYALMAGLMLVGVATILAAPDPGVPEGARLSGLAETVLAPFGDFMRHPGWAVILLFVVLYNLGDATAGHMAGPFYFQLGFSRDEVAGVSKIFGVVAALVGVSLGGIVVWRIGIMRTLFLCGLAKMAANFMYLVQLRAGHDVGMLFATIGTENLTSGMASSAFVAYLSRLCNPAYTATQYALLSALAAVARTMLSSWGGVVAERVGWSDFFLLSIALAVPSLLLLLLLDRRARVAPA